MSLKLNRMYRSKEDGLNDMELKRSILKMEIELEILFRILIDKKLVTHEEINEYRMKIFDEPKYKNVFRSIKRQEDQILNPPINPDLRALIKTIEASERITCVCPPTFRFENKWNKSFLEEWRKYNEA